MDLLLLVLRKKNNRLLHLQQTKFRAHLLVPTYLNQEEKDVVENLAVENLAVENLERVAELRDAAVPKDVAAVNLDNKYKKLSSGTDWTFGGIGEKLTDKLLRNGDVVDDIYKYVDDYKRELEGSELESLKTKVKSCVRKKKYSEQGYDFDLSRVLNGDPDYRIEVTQEGKKHFPQ